MNPFTWITAKLMAQAVVQIKQAIKESAKQIMSALTDELAAIKTQIDSNTATLTTIDANVKALQAAIAANDTAAIQAAADAIQASLTANTAATAQAATDATPK